jgi:hypothetical protein
MPREKHVLGDILGLRTFFTKVHCNQNTISTRNKDEDVKPLSRTKKKKLSKFLVYYKTPEDIRTFPFSSQSFRM